MPPIGTIVMNVACEGHHQLAYIHCMRDGVRWHGCTSGGTAALGVVRLQMVWERLPPGCSDVGLAAALRDEGDLGAKWTHTCADASQTSRWTWTQPLRLLPPRTPRPPMRRQRAVRATPAPPIRRRQQGAAAPPCVKRPPRHPRCARQAFERHRLESSVHALKVCDTDGRRSVDSSRLC